MDAIETTEQAVARTLADADDLGVAYPRVLQLMAERLGWAFAAAWEPGPDGKPPLRCVASWLAADAFEPFDGVSFALALDPGEGLPGRVWESSAPEWIEDVVADLNFPRARVARDVGLHAALCFPARSARGVVAVVELLDTTRRKPDEDLLRTLTSLGDQMGLAIERRRADQAAHVGDQRNRAMLEAALDAVVAIDHRGRIFAFNPAAERTFGYDADAVMGEDMAALIVPPSLRARHRAGLARYLVTGDGPVLDRRVEITGMRSDGSEFPVELTIARIDLPGPPRFTAYVRDITDRKRQEEELKASRARMVQAADDARRRLEHDLHDGAQQRLVGLALDLRLARSRLGSEPEEAARLLDEATEELAAATSELRELARGIHPAVLTDGGLEPALRTLVARAAVPTRLHVADDRRLAPAIEVTAYFTVAEALTNVARYAEARSVEVSLGYADGTLVVEVRDDGRGGADAGGGTGLRGLADRVTALDGSLSVDSPAGAGTIIRAEIPCAS
ncbi:MAG TPA: PAS domain S-box protein [Solirubrobacteraceae bacterium]|jgi:PAS domain S-box-containing protein|nr:PAS domain S-box protein [Solirubrobacteraceae bacterium]